MTTDAIETTAETITVNLDGPAGPCVDYTEADDAEAVERALPEGWTVDFSSQIKLASGEYRAPLVHAPRTYTLRFGDDSTVWIDVEIHDDNDEYETITVSVDPLEPECDDEEGHDWQSPHSVLGGLESNPGVQGHGGGVIIREVCACCGAYRITDTWAQRPDTGEQGLRSVEYREADSDSLPWVESLLQTYAVCDAPADHEGEAALVEIHRDRRPADDEGLRGHMEALAEGRAWVWVDDDGSAAVGDTVVIDEDGCAKIVED